MITSTNDYFSKNFTDKIYQSNFLWLSKHFINVPAPLQVGQTNKSWFLEAWLIRKQTASLKLDNIKFF